MRRFAAGVVVGLVLAAGSSRAGLGEYAELKLIRIELKRIANALDRLVSMESQRPSAEKGPRT